MNPRFKVAITDFIADAPEPERRVLGDLADVEILGARSEDDLVGRIEDFDAIQVYHTITVSAKTIARLHRCRLIVRCGVGYDNVDRVFARERGIPVANVPDYGTEEVADSAIGMMLALTRGIAILNSVMQKSGDAWNYTAAGPLQRLRGRVFAIIGLGRIGTAAACRAKALGMDVAYYDPYKPDGYDKALGVRRVESLEELLSQAHVLSLHCPLTQETTHMIDKNALARLSPDTYLINTARGAIVDTAQIPDAIASGILAGAGLDVLEQEPPPAGDPLILAWRNPSHPAHHRVLITPHAAFYSKQGLIDLRIKGSEACRRALVGEPLRNIVN